MTHPLVLGLFESPAAAAAGARELRRLGLSSERVSIVARNHDEAGELAKATDATPGSEIEDSRLASRLGELSAHLIAAIAVVLPGVGPIVADGPLSAGMGEAAGHLAGGLARTLEDAGLSEQQAAEWQSHVQQGAVIVAGHANVTPVADVKKALHDAGASNVVEGAWRD